MKFRTTVDAKRISFISLLIIDIFQRHNWASWSMIAVTLIFSQASDGVMLPHGSQLRVHKPDNQVKVFSDQ